jgi:hypothetical protein
MPQQDIDELYEQIKATGKEGGVIVAGKMVERTLYGTARVIPPTVSQAELVSGPSTTSNLPLSNTQLNKYRGTRDFQEAARRQVDPDTAGTKIAEAFYRALDNDNDKMLKTILPIIYGNLEKQADDTEANAGMEALFAALTNPKPKRESRQRKVQLVEGTLNDVQEELTTKQESDNA